MCHGCGKACRVRSEIQRPRAERILRTARHAFGPGRCAWVACDHLGRWRPFRPRGFSQDRRASVPAETFTTHADAIAHRLALRQDEIKKVILGIDDNGPVLFRRFIGHYLPEVFRINLADIDGGDRKYLIVLRGIPSAIGGIEVRFHWDVQCKGSEIVHLAAARKNRKSQQKGSTVQHFLLRLELDVMRV